MAKQVAIIAGVNGAVGRAMAARLGERFTVLGIARKPVETLQHRVFVTRYDGQGLAGVRREILGQPATDPDAPS